MFSSSSGVNSGGLPSTSLTDVTGSVLTISGTETWIPTCISGSIIGFIPLRRVGCSFSELSFRFFAFGSEIRYFSQLQFAYSKNLFC